MQNTISIRDRLRLAKFVLTADRFTQGPEVRKFEEQWSEWIGSKHSLFVSSGSTANSLLIASWKELYGIPDGAEVLVPACTWVTNVAPVFQNKLRPIFCDVNLSDYSFDYDALKDIAHKHPDIKGVFVTHLLGYPSDVEKIKSIFPNAHILEDVCESHGAVIEQSNGDCIAAGTYGIGGTFSFYFGHHMTTIEGGMVVTNDTELYDLMRVKRSHGLARESGNFPTYASQNPDINPSFLFVSDGYNFRNTEVGAILGQSQLKRLSDMVVRRQENYEDYWEVISEHEDKFILPSNNPHSSSFAFPFICKEKETYEKLKKLFDDYHVEYRPVVGGNLLKQPFLKKYKNTQRLPNADTLHERGLYIGNNHFLEIAHFDMLYEILNRL